MDNIKKYCVYMHTFPNGKIYIGITCVKPIYRWGKDGAGYKPKKEGSSRIWNAIKKYGWNNVIHEILYSDLTEEEACLKEAELIDLYKSNNINFGYNISPGGGSHALAEETKQKISDARKGNNYGMIGENAPFYGHYHTEDAKVKISNAMSGVNNPFYGKKHTDEVIENEVISHLYESKPIEQYDKDGNFLNFYFSIHEASRRTGINRACIMAALKGDQKTAGKCIWKYSSMTSVEVFSKNGSLNICISNSK